MIWGRVIDCKDYANPVRWGRGRLSPSGTWFDAGAEQRHHCAAQPLREVPDIVECVCSDVVVRYSDGRKEDYLAGKPHKCRRRKVAK